MIHVRSEYTSRFGREELTLWSGAFCDDYEGFAWELPRHDGYMVTMYDGRQIRVSCESPRTDDNYRAVDEAIRRTVDPAAFGACGYPGCHRETNHDGGHG